MITCCGLEAIEESQDREPLLLPLLPLPRPLAPLPRVVCAPLHVGLGPSPAIAASADDLLGAGGALKKDMPQLAAWACSFPSLNSLH